MFSRRKPASENASLRCAGRLAADSRDDMSAARGIVQWVAVCAALWVVGLGVVFSDVVRVCTNEFPSGGAWDLCSGYVDIDTTLVQADDLVQNWDEGDGWFGTYPGDINPDYQVYNFTTEEFESWYTFAWVPPEDDEDPPDDDEEFSPEDIDFDKAAGAFGAAFILVGLFWGLGKAVGIVINSVRRF